MIPRLRAKAEPQAVSDCLVAGVPVRTRDPDKVFAIPEFFKELPAEQRRTALYQPRVRNGNLFFPYDV